jgi:hypothetical protein
VASVAVHGPVPLNEVRALEATALNATTCDISEYQST